jgi:O-acetyl-ADP-ribose deacetylase
LPPEASGNAAVSTKIHLRGLGPLKLIEMCGRVAEFSAKKLYALLQAQSGAQAMPRLIAVQGDITKTSVDAIVNAANSSMLGGGGVDGAIHRAAGSELLEACEKLGGCATGDAKATPAFRLPAKWVFHAVGPVWHGGKSGEDELLTSCYARCMTLARQHDARSIAFPAISTGVYRFPPERAARIAVETVKAHLEGSGVSEVRFMCFDAETLKIYQRVLAESDSSNEAIPR